MPVASEIRQQRQQAILDILQRQAVRRQSELVQLLRADGIDATQSSVSRDLQLLGINKLGDGYAPVNEGIAAGNADLGEISGLVRQIETAGGGITVIKTAIGAAQRVAVYLDRSDWPEIVGTVSGDDTIFVATKNAQTQRQLLSRFRSAL
ncbi:MAG: arginine repressor [Gammaproteobacteria bacterium]